MATKRNTDHWALSASGMTNVRTMPVTTKTATRPTKSGPKGTGRKRGGR